MGRATQEVQGLLSSPGTPLREQECHSRGREQLSLFLSPGQWHRGMMTILHPIENVNKEKKELRRTRWKYLIEMNNN